MSFGPSSQFGSPSSRDNFTLKPTQSSEVELRDIVTILRRRRTIVFAATVIGMLVAAFSVFFAQKEYSSTATIEINKSSDNSLGLADLSGMSTGLSGESEVNMDLLTEQAVILSDNTALRVVELLKLEQAAPYAIPPSKDVKISAIERERDLPLEQAPLRRTRLLAIFKGRLRVGLIKGTRLLTVTYTDTDPNRSTQIANAVVDVYINEYTQARYQASSKASSWLTGQLADLKDKVEASQTKVEEFQRESGLTGMTISVAGGGSSENRNGGPSVTTSSDNVPLERLIELNHDLTNAEVTRIAKEAIFRMTETQDPDVVIGIGSSSLATGLEPGSPFAPGSQDLILLQELRVQRAQLQTQIASAETKYGPKNPAIVQLSNEASSLDAQIHAELSRLRTRAKNDLDLAVLAEDGIRQQITGQEQVVNKVSEKADQLILLQEEALSSREIYQDLYTKLEEASVTAGIRASNITLVNPARTPVQPSFPKKRMAVALGGLIGLFFGLLSAFMWDYFDDSISIPEQVEQLTSYPVIGAIPDFAQKSSSASKYGLVSKPSEAPEAKSQLWLIRAPRSHVAEAYRALRTALLMSKAEAPPRMILIMSGSPAEGKSTTCLNTAAAFAIQGDRVLYLDADLRRAQAHKYFNASNDVGLSNCLTSGLSFENAVKPHPDIGSLFLLPAGPHPPNPSELIGSKRFAELLGQLRTKFDYVFIDSPPVLLVTDAQLMSTLVDGYVLVLRSNRTTKRLLQRCLALMRASKALNLGLVVNAISAKSAAYSGYGYYGSGSGYYVEEKE